MTLAEWHNLKPGQIFKIKDIIGTSYLILSRKDSTYICKIAEARDSEIRKFVESIFIDFGNDFKIDIFDDTDIRIMSVRLSLIEVIK